MAGTQIGRLSRLQLDLRDHDLVERIMRRKGTDVSSPDPAPDTRLAAQSQPPLVITSDHFKFGAPNRHKSESRMRHHRHSR